MVNIIDFYAFRGNVIFSDQISLFNLGLKNNSETKNKIFNDFFNMLEQNGRFDSKYQKRVYYLIFINRFDTIIHCQLARERFFDKYEMTKSEIIETKDQDYPFVNVFIECNSQKFLIESNTAIFENYNTCSDVIRNIINKHIEYSNASIEINPIIDEQEFWKYFNTENTIKKISFSLNAPNLFDATDDATIFLKEAEKNVGANKVSIEFQNDEKTLSPNKHGIDSYVKYASAGGGRWKVKYIDKDGKTYNVSSNQKSLKVSIELPKIDLSKRANREKIKLVLKKFEEIETIDKFKENES